MADAKYSRFVNLTDEADQGKWVLYKSVKQGHCKSENDQSIYGESSCNTCRCTFSWPPLYPTFLPPTLSLTPSIPDSLSPLVFLEHVKCAFKLDSWTYYHFCDAFLEPFYSILIFFFIQCTQFLFLALFFSIALTHSDRICILLNILYNHPTKTCSFHEGKYFGNFYSLLYFQNPEKYLEHSKCSNISWIFIWIVLDTYPSSTLAHLSPLSFCYLKTEVKL